MSDRLITVLAVATVLAEVMPEQDSPSMYVGGVFPDLSFQLHGSTMPRLRELSEILSAAAEDAFRIAPAEWADRTVTTDDCSIHHRLQRTFLGVSVEIVTLEDPPVAEPVHTIDDSIAEIRAVSEHQAELAAQAR